MKDDTISRAAALTALNGCTEIYLNNLPPTIYKKDAVEAVTALPPAQPEIIRCRECKFASGDSRICMKFDHSPIGELDFCAWAERRTDEE